MLRNIKVQTFLARFITLFLNFGLVIFSTNVWGSEGKGIISIITADLSIIGFFTNIFVGGSISYFSSRFRTEQILPYSYLWALVVGFAVSAVIYFVHPSEYTFYLFGLSVMLGLLSANISLFIGKKNLRMFNLYNVLQQALHFGFILGIVYIFRVVSVHAYFIAQILCFAVLFFMSSYHLLKRCNISEVRFSKKTAYQLFDYGWKSQLSAFIHFLNSRLSFYFLELFKGVSSVGIFSIGVAFSEAIWIVSKSLALVLYSDVLNTKNVEESILKTKIALKFSFLVTLLFIVIILLFPEKIYIIIFGKDFGETKKIIMLLSPGIIAMALGNIVGFYFAGINKLRILNIKSSVGLLFTISISFYIIPKWGIWGVCFITSASYCLSSTVLLWQFYKITDFRIQDYLFSKGEINVLLKKIINR